MYTPCVLYIRWASRCASFAGGKKARVSPWRQTCGHVQPRLAAIFVVRRSGQDKYKQEEEKQEAEMTSLQRIHRA